MERIGTLLATCWLLHSIPASAQLANSPWPMFGHDLRHSGQSQYNGPVVAPVVKWHNRVATYVKGAPIVGPSDAVYLGFNMKLCKFDPATGATDSGTFWCFQLPAHMRRNSPAIGVDGKVYIGDRANRLWSVNPNGTANWSYAVGNDGDVNTSPAIGPDGTIYMAGTWNGIVHALNPNGSLKWKLPCPPAISYSSPALDANQVTYIGTTLGFIHAIKPDGTQDWATKVGGKIRFVSPAIGPTGKIYTGYAQGIAALNPDGTSAWPANYAVIGGFSSTPAVATDGTIYAAGGFGSHAALYAVNPDGTEKWTRPGPFYSSPAIGANGIVYVAGGGMVSAYNSAGTYLWAVPIGRRKRIVSSPAIGSDGTLYIASDGLYALHEP
jgi:hypothetical protein